MYYLVIVQNNNTQAVYSYNSIEAALAAYHSELAYRAEGRTSTKCAILDSELMLVRSETYTASVNTEPAEEPQEG